MQTYAILATLSNDSGMLYDVMKVSLAKTGSARLLIIIVNAPNRRVTPVIRKYCGQAEN